MTHLHRHSRPIAALLIAAGLLLGSGCETFKDRVAEESNAGACCRELGIDVSALLGKGGSDCGVIQTSYKKSLAAHDNRLAKSCIESARNAGRPFVVRYVANVWPDATYEDIYVFGTQGEKVWIHWQFDVAGDDSHVATCKDLKFGRYLERPQGECVYDNEMLERIRLAAPAAAGTASQG